MKRLIYVLAIIALASCKYDYGASYDNLVKSYGVVKDSLTLCYIHYAEEIIKYNNQKDTTDLDNLVNIIKIQDSIISEYDNKKDYYLSREFLIDNQEVINKKVTPIYSKINDSILSVDNYNIKINLLTNEIIDE